MMRFAKLGLAEKELVYFVKGRIFNNLLYVQYAHLTNAKPIHKR
jgi:hypothetical protein